jgi:hypothetical protein
MSRAAMWRGATFPFVALQQQSGDWDGAGIGPPRQTEEPSRSRYFKHC